MRPLSQNLRLTRLVLLLATVPGLLLGCDELRAGETDDLRGVFFQVEGSVTLTPDGAEIRIARPFQVIPGGALITVPASATAELVCSTHHHIQLEAGTEWSLTRDACAEGHETSPDTYHLLAPHGGRQHPIGKLIAVARHSRGSSEDRRVPVLLSPRNGAVLEGRPDLRWIAVDTAIEYEIELQGRRGSFIERLPINKVSCAPDPKAWGAASVCTAPYPTDQPELVPGASYFLSIGARESMTSPLYKLPYGEPLRRLNTDQASTLKDQLASRRWPLGNEALDWLMAAGTYAEYDLLTDAALAYRHALALEPAAEIQVNLGDILLLSGLLEFAATHYQAASQASSEPVVKAAAAFGLGQCDMARRRFREALARFEHAREIYAQLGLEEEASSAEKLAAKAAARQKR